MNDTNETQFLLAERDRLTEIGERFGLRLTGFDHLGSISYGGPFATYVDDTTKDDEVRLPYWFLDRLEPLQLRKV